MQSNLAKVLVDESPDGEVVLADDTLQSDLPSLLVEVNEDLVVVVETLVHYHCRDVLLLQVVLQVAQLVLFATEEQVLSLKLKSSSLVLSQQWHLLQNVKGVIGNCSHWDYGLGFTCRWDWTSRLSNSRDRGRGSDFNNSFDSCDLIFLVHSLNG